MPFWPMVWFIFSALALCFSAAVFQELRKVAIASNKYEQFKTDIYRCIGFCALFIAFIWHFDWLPTPLKAETLESLSFVEGTGIIVHKKGDSNLGIQTASGEWYDWPAFDFTLFGNKDDPSVTQVVEQSVGHSIQIWYKKQFHRYVYQFVLEGDVIYSLQEANRSIEHFNRWIPTSSLTLFSCYFLTVYLKLRNLQNLEPNKIKA